MPLRAIQPRGPDTRGCAAVRPPGSAVLTQCPLANVCRRSSLVRAGPTCVATAAPRQSDASVHTRRAAGFALKFVYRSGAKAAKDARTNSSAPRAAVLATTARRSLPLWRRYISWTRQRHLLLNISTEIQEPARTSSSATERRGSRAACTVRYDGPSLLRFRPLFVHRIALSDAEANVLAHRQSGCDRSIACSLPASSRGNWRGIYHHQIVDHNDSDWKRSAGASVQSQQLLQRQSAC